MKVYILNTTHTVISIIFGEQYHDCFGSQNIVIVESL